MVAIMSAINQGYAVGGAWKVTEKFCELGNTEVFYTSVDPSKPPEPFYMSEVDTSDWAGNHAMAIVGYFHINANPFFLVQNSWGHGFGRGGRCLFHRDFVDQAWDLTVVRSVP